MHKNSTHLVKGEQHLTLDKAHVFEAELSVGHSAAETQRNAPLCASLAQVTENTFLMRLVKLCCRGLFLSSFPPGGPFPTCRTSHWQLCYLCSCLRLNLTLRCVLLVRKLCKQVISIMLRQ